MDLSGDLWFMLLKVFDRIKAKIFQHPGIISRIFICWISKNNEPSFAVLTQSL